MRGLTGAKRFLSHQAVIYTTSTRVKGHSINHRALWGEKNTSDTDTGRRTQSSSTQPPMANNCQMMCVIKTENMLRSLWSHPSSRELISYVNERFNKRSPESHSTRAYTLCTHQTPPHPPPFPNTPINKKKRLTVSDKSVSHTQLVLVLVKNPSGEGVVVIPPT